MIFDRINAVLIQSPYVFNVHGGFFISGEIMEQELSLPEYQGLSYTEKLNLLLSKTETRTGKIEGENLKDVVTLLCSGLDWKLKNAPDSMVKTALVRGFDSMNLPGFGFNLNDPTVMGLLNLANSTVVTVDGSMVKLISDEEKQYLIGLASYEAKRWPNATVKDIVSLLEPELLSTDEDWSKPFEYVGSRLMLNLQQSLPELSTVRVEASESIDGVNWSKFKRVHHFYNVADSGVYFTDVPVSYVQRKIRWRGEHYKVIGTVVGV